MSNANTGRQDMVSSPGAATSPFELQFLDTMIAHHQIAIDAAQLVATRAQHDELKQLAKSIIRDQQTEIAKMRDWREAWFGEPPPAINIGLPGMSEGMAEMDLEKLDALKENAFDLEFLRQMIPHHEGAVAMAKDLQNKEARADLKTLAQNIIETQTAEIEQMKSWENEWRRN